MDEENPQWIEGIDEEPVDSVCCFCDNGGLIICCEGVCMRSFHPTQSATRQAQSRCASLGLSEQEVESMPCFQCKNCQYKEHQCFSCWQLGSSDTSLGAEVFQCANPSCGYFYHARCVAKQLHPDSKVAAKKLVDEIYSGEPFTCPHHICAVCRQPEDKTIPALQMAVCRRCPYAYHVRCLPREIAYEENEEEGIVVRAWRDMLLDRVMIYCLDHDLGDDGTPESYIRFPGDEIDEM